MRPANARADELVMAWREVGYRLQELSVATENAMAFAAPGNQSDTGIMEEVYALLGALGLSPHNKENIYKALSILLDEAEEQKDEERATDQNNAERAKMPAQPAHAGVRTHEPINQPR